MSDRAGGPFVRVLLVIGHDLLRGRRVDFSRMVGEPPFAPHSRRRRRGEDKKEEGEEGEEEKEGKEEKEE